MLRANQLACTLKGNNIINNIDNYKPTIETIIFNPKLDKIIPKNLRQ